MFMNFVVLFSSLAAFHAQPAPPPHAMVVHLRGLDLHSMSGSAIAVQRIHDAARAFCAVRSAPHDVDVTVLKCRREMSLRAVERTHSSEVKAVYMEYPSGMMFADAG
jgi:UrcA family protein